MDVVEYWVKMLGLCSERMVYAVMITVCVSSRGVLLELEFAINLGGVYIKRNAA